MSTHRSFRNLALSLALAAGACGIWTLGRASADGIQPEPAAKQPPSGPLDKKQLSEMMQQFSGPSEKHKLLDQFAGDFNADIQISVMPGTPPMKAKATFHAEWVLGKRFIQSTSKAAEGEDLKIESLGYFGYDTRKAKYTWYGMDTMGTYGVMAMGDYNEEKKTLTLYGEQEEPGMGKMRFKTVVVLENPDRRTLEILFELPAGRAPEGVPTTKDGWASIFKTTLTRK